MSAARPARRPLRVDHVAFPVFDAAATFRFYTEVMRLPLVEAASLDLLRGPERDDPRGDGAGEREGDRDEP